MKAVDSAVKMVAYWAALMAGLMAFESAGDSAGEWAYGLAEKMALWKAYSKVGM